MGDLSIFIVLKKIKNLIFCPNIFLLMQKEKLNRFMKTNVTISEIAKKTGLSRAAVSKALNDKEDISLKTRKMVKKVAKEMGYSVNIAAKMLSMQKTKTIGVVVPFPQNPSVTERIKGIQDEALEASYLTSMAFHDGDPENEIKQIRLLHGRVDGIIITPVCQSADLRSSLKSCKLPLVLMSEHLSEIEADYVSVDDEEAGRIAAEHLTQKNHANIAYLGSSPGAYSDQKLLEGFKRFCNSAKKQCKIFPYWGCIDKNSTFKNMEAVLSSSNITAIFAFSDHAALWAMDFLSRNPGKSIAIIGCDDIELASMEKISLTSISQPNLEIGRQAAKMLLERLTSDPAITFSPRRIIFPPTLKARKSTFDISF
jgi:LacI family transcriptional regulator